MYLQSSVSNFRDDYKINQFFFDEAVFFVNWGEIEGEHLDVHCRQASHKRFAFIDQFNVELFLGVDLGLNSFEIWEICQEAYFLKQFD